MCWGIAYEIRNGKKRVSGEVIATTGSLKRFLQQNGVDPSSVMDDDSIAEPDTTCTCGVKRKPFIYIAAMIFLAMIRDVPSSTITVHDVMELARCIKDTGTGTASSGKKTITVTIS